MKTTKQKQATNRNFTIRQLKGMLENLRMMQNKTSNTEIKKALNTAKTYTDYALMLVSESNTEDWYE